MSDVLFISATFHVFSKEHDENIINNDIKACNWIFFRGCKIFF